MKLYLVRHGETAWNREKRFQGWSGAPLSEAGRAQARELARRLKGVEPAAVVSSDLDRARETAEIIIQERGWRVPHILDKRLRELYHGPLEGVSMFSLSCNPELRWPKEAETIGDLCRRVWDFLTEARERWEGRELVVVGHQVVNSVLRLLWMGFPPGDPAFELLERCIFASMCLRIRTRASFPELLQSPGSCVVLE